MNLLAAFASALRALATNWLRSMLTMLGIIIGVAAVITMIAIGGGAQARVEAQIKALGSNVMLVLPGARTAGGVRLGAQTGQSLTEADAQAIAVEVPEVQAAAPSLRTGAQVVAANSNWSTAVLGTTADYLEVRDWPLAAGRGFEAAEQAGSGKVAVIGQTVATQLFGDADPLDQMIRVRTVPLQVIGVLDSKGQNSIGQDQDDIIVVPLSTFRNRIQGMSAGRIKRVSAVSVKIREGQSMAAAEEKIRELLRQRHRTPAGAEDDFSIRNLTEVLQAEEESSRVMALLLAAVAGVSLVVGGIGIMNIMLVSVTERTREIGIRKAIGALRRDILTQFLLESLTLSLLGGAIGIALGLLISFGASRAFDINLVVDLNTILLSATFAGVVGLVFGIYPAWRASNLAPIEALRYE
jgi:putative ABC transport system permease protein